MAINPGRWTATPVPTDEPVTVFLIGMRVNRWWKPWQWSRTGMAMGRMLTHLAKNPESGLLSFHSWFGRTTMLLSYWQSQEHLVRFARDPDLAHLPAWRTFNKAVGGGGDVGVWHETYQIKPSPHEVVYVNMPAFGLGRALGVEQLGTGTSTATQRWKRAAAAE